MDKIPEEIEARAKNIILNLLPAKSREQYEKEYQLFKEWEVKNNVGTVSEEVILTYLHEKSKFLKPSSLWSKYSMLKATLGVKEGVKLENYSNVIAFLKRNAVGYEAKKSKVLSREEVNKFLKEASDDIYLMTKVALVIGICGACRREELHSLQVSDIVDMGNSLIVTLADTKTNKKRVFSVTADAEAINPLELYHKYARLRPPVVNHNYFFVNYRNKKCTIQRSTSVAEGYIEDSIEQKKKVAKLIMGKGEMYQSTSSDTTENTTHATGTSTSTSLNITHDLTHVATASTVETIKGATQESTFTGNTFYNCNFSFYGSK